MMPKMTKWPQWWDGMVVVGPSSVHPPTHPRRLLAEEKEPLVELFLVQTRYLFIGLYKLWTEERIASQHLRNS